MAFASQSNCIKRAVPRNDSGDLQAYEEVFVHVNDFQTLLFQPLWHEARRSLEWFGESIGQCTKFPPSLNRSHLGTAQG
jgi:hypothetical protein